MKMKMLRALLLVMPSLGLLAGPTTIPLYENYGILTNTPQVDAVSFANYGLFGVGSVALYDTQNTLNFTNTGIMQAAPGFYFDTVDDAGYRHRAANFYNGPGASITVQNNGALAAGFRVDATNIVTRSSSIHSDITGIIQILGQNVDLSRTVVSIDPVTQSGAFQSYYPNYMYSDDYGIEDLYWGFGEELPRFQSSQLVTSYRGAITAQAPNACVTNSSPGFCMGGGFFLSAPATFVYTNWNSDGTNTQFTVSVGIIGVQDTNFNVGVHFYPSDLASNYYNSIAFQMGAYLTNTATQSRDLYQLFLTDRLAAEQTNVMVLLTNAATGDMPYRPGAYELSRSPSLEYAMGRPANATNDWFKTNLAGVIYTPMPGLPTTNVVTNIVIMPTPGTGTNYETDIITNIVTTSPYYYNLVTNYYAGYGAFVTNNIPIVPVSPVASITNAEGRIEINADVLNLERTRMRAEGNITVATRQLVSSTNAGIDVASIYYDLGSTNGLLKLQSLTIPVVQRLSGSVYAWTGMWTNYYDIITNSITNGFVTNVMVDPTQSTNYTYSTNGFTTNTVQVNLNVSMVDATSLQSRWPTFVNGLATRSTNVFMDDTVRVMKQLYVDGTTLTVSTNGQFLIGDLNTAGALTDWNTTEFPNLLYLTNNGLISVPNVADFGTPTAPYERFVNTGTNAAFALHYNVKDFQASGYIATEVFLYAPDGTLIPYLAEGAIHINANTVEMQNGVMDAFYSDIVLNANSVKWRNYTNDAAGMIQLNVSGDLSDSGWDAGVVLDCSQGIQLTTKPATGSLLGTTINVNTLANSAVDCVWAAEDRGASSRGFTNNAAIGHLFLNPALNGQITFGPVGTANALYVDYLEFSPTAQTDLKGSLILEPGFKIYYASANLTPDQISAAFGNQIVPVTDFVGPHSSMPVVVTLDPNSNPPKQVSFLVNTLLRNSTTIDSDGNGTANAYELDPFKGPKMKVWLTNLPPMSVAISWNVAAQTVYHVDYATNLDNTGWQPLTIYTNTLNTATNAIFLDPAGVTNAPRYYRVSYSPEGTGL